MAELAILLPVLLLLVFGMIEMSNAWRTFQVVTNAAREGARVGILRTSTEANIRDRIDEHLVGGGLNPTADGAVISVLCFDQNGGSAGTVCTRSGEEVRIRIDYPFTFTVLGRLGNLVPITISSTSTMRHE